MWVMHPVVHAEHFSVSSSITVNLALDEGVELPEDVSLGDFAAHIEDGDENTKEEAFQEENGTWTASFRYLLPDVGWELTLVVPEGLEVETDPELPTEVVTESGADVEVNLVITGVEEEEEDS
jgi:hypothetical protein